MVFKREHSLLLNTLFFISLFQACVPVYAIPVNLLPTPSEGIKYPINIACECDYYLYVDGKYIEQANKEVNIVEKIEYGHPGWNATKTFNPIIYDESPKIIAFYGTGNQFPGFVNGFVMDMNDGKDYTKHEEWKCKDFSSTVNKVPAGDWFTVDYDDKDWMMSTSFGKNYQNNSFQIFETERVGISLQAEWLWTSDNSNSNVYCRKKNGNVKTIPLEVTTSPAQTSAPSQVHVSTTIHPTVAQTSMPTPDHVSKTIHPTIAQTSAPNGVLATVSKMIHTTPAQTSASSPVHVSTTIHPTVAQTSAPNHVLKTVHPVVAQTSAPNHVSKTIHPIVAQTSAPNHVSKTIHPTVAQTSAPNHVSKTIHPIVAQTSAPNHVSKTVHPTPAQTSAPNGVLATVLTKIHPTHAQTSAPPPVHVLTTLHLKTTPPPPPPPSTPSTISPVPVSTTVSPPVAQTLTPPTNYNIVISPHIKIIIQNVKYSRNRSYNHIDNLLRKLKIYHDDDDIYQQILHTRYHVQHHYDTILHDIRRLIHLLHSRNDEDRATKQTPRFIQSMHKLDTSIKKIEESLQFIKGNHKYILIRILQKLKLQYHNDTLRLLHKWNNNFV
jgi:hypothetical protein